MSDVVLTGPPRSGTTLTCELLNEVDDTVALDEPMDRDMWPVKGRRDASVTARLRGWLGSRSTVEAIDPAVFSEEIGAFFESTRRSLLSGEGAISLQHAGQVHGGKFPDASGPSGLREDVTTRSVMPVAKPLTKDFVLAVKHIAGFTAMLPELSKRFRCFAIVRNPLSTMSSWQTVSAPISSGRIPRGERLDPDLRGALKRLTDVTDRQFVILRWFFEAFRSLPVGAVLRYEDIIASQGRALATISPAAGRLARPLESRNTAEIYDRQKMRELGERLLGTEGGWWDHYSLDDVRSVMAG